MCTPCSSKTVRDFGNGYFKIFDAKLWAKILKLKKGIVIVRTVCSLPVRERLNVITTLALLGYILPNALMAIPVINQVIVLITSTFSFRT